MKDIIIKKEYLERFKNTKKAYHEKAFIVNEIIKVVGESKVYNYGYWLKQLKNFEQNKGRLGIIYGWLKNINQAPSQYNKGGILTNKFKKWKNEIIK